VLPAAAQETYIFDDFRDIPWGTHIDSAFDQEGNKIKFRKNDLANGANAYEIIGDHNMIGTVEMEKILYLFTEDDRFEGVRMSGNSAKSFHEMKYILIYKFGEAKIKDITDGIVYGWIVDGVRINLTLNTLTDKFTVEFASDYTISKSRRINRNVQDF
jgi:hypothetical protein